MKQLIQIKLVTLFFLMLSCAVSAQNKNHSEGSRIIIDSGNISNTSYFLYEPTFKAKGIYKNINEVKNDYPEELMSSILCANTQKWVNFNTLRGDQETETLPEEPFKKEDFNTTYFELLSKFEFTANNSKMAIIKFMLHHKKMNKPVAGVISMQNIDGKWKKTTAPYLSKMSMVLLVFKPDVLGRLLEGRSNNEFELMIIKTAYNKNGLDFNKLLQIKLNDQEKEVLTNPLNW